MRINCCIRGEYAHISTLGCGSAVLVVVFGAAFASAFEVVVEWVKGMLRGVDEGAAWRVWTSGAFCDLDGFRRQG